MGYVEGAAVRRPSPEGMSWFVRGDIDGFFGLAIDNLVQLLVIVALCRGVLGFSDDLVLGTILPGAAISLVVGNVFYGWQAMALSRRTGRTDVCALPYGINTVSLFAFVFLVMLPALLAAKARGLGDEEAALAAWRMGLAACLGSGIIELLGALFAERLRRATPRAALLSTLAGIALGFISFSFLFRTYASPVVGLATLGVVLLVYFGKVRFKGGLPGGLVAVALGVALSFATGLVPPNPPTAESLGLYLPLPVLGDILSGLSADDALTYVSVIVPMGIFSVLGSLQNIESAEAAGDSFPTAPSLAVNGIGTIAAALFGSCFPTTIYIGHPGWKAIGARAGYSILNAAFFTVLCLTGSLAFIAWLVPIEAGMAIVLWIGIIMAAQSFDATPRHHAPAVVLGLLPGLGAWGVLMAKGWAARGRRDVLAGARGKDGRLRQLHLRRFCTRARLHLHGHDPVGSDGPAHRAALRSSRPLVCRRRGTVGRRSHAQLHDNPGRLRRRFRRPRVAMGERICSDGGRFPGGEVADGKSEGIRRFAARPVAAGWR